MEVLKSQRWAIVCMHARAGVVSVRTYKNPRAYLLDAFGTEHGRRTLNATDFKTMRACERHFDVLAIAEENYRYAGMRESLGGGRKGRKV